MDPFAADLAEILDDTKQTADVTQGGVTRRVRLAIADATRNPAGYLPIDAEAAATTATLLRADLPFPLSRDATVAIAGRRYRVAAITETPGDPAITLTLAIEGAAP